MKIIIIYAMALTTILSGCSEKNPLLSNYNTEFNAPPFDKIEVTDYLPAFQQAILEARAEVDDIISSTEEPTFANTIEMMAMNGDRLNEVASIFYALNSANTNSEIEAVAIEIQPLLTEFSNDVSLNKELFKRVKRVYDNRASFDLDLEQKRLLEDTYKGFTRSGAALNDADKDKYRALTNELASLTLKFQQNLLAATNDFVLEIPAVDSAKIEELPQFVKDAMAEDAKSKDINGWCITLHAPSYIPFMTYSSNRELKEMIWKVYMSRCFTEGDQSNVEVVKRVTELRLNIAKLLGYTTYADYILEDRMAESRENVETFLNDLLDASIVYARQDYNTLEEYALDKNSSLKKLMPWDFAYYEELYKSEKYSLNEEEVKPYLQLETVSKGIFTLAERLFGLRFVANEEIPKYHEDVKVYEVYDESDAYKGLLYMDFFPRATKRNGAWMTTFRSMYVDNKGVEVRPLVSLCCNFTKPTENTPSLLTFDEFVTLLHEFGHGLHGLLAEGKYASLTGTSVHRDFVELPSQLLENWATEREFLDMWAVHYQTGEKMPKELIDKILAAKNYNAAYANARQLSFGLNDMAWHTITEPVTGDIAEFERNATNKCKVLPTVDGTCFSTAFSHIFAGGYAVGYYSYKWAEVLEADAFEYFKQNGIFNREIADSYKDNILTKGGTEHPMDLYVRFRGQKPDVKSLLRKIGVE